VVAGAFSAAEATTASTFVLTRDMLARGLCSDLADGEHDRREFERRAGEAARLLQAAGIPVKLEL
jgi:bifunctional enzyme CysN/CysC